WYDRRNDPANNLIERFGDIGDISNSGTKVTFGPNFVYNRVAFPPINGLDPVVNPSYMGDYDQAAADNQFFYTTWGDNRSPSAGHPGNNADVRFAKISVSGPGKTPVNVLVNDPVEVRLNTPADTQSESALLVIPGPTPTVLSAYNDSSSFNVYTGNTDPGNQF